MKVEDEMMSTSGSYISYPAIVPTMQYMFSDATARPDAYAAIIANKVILDKIEIVDQVLVDEPM